MTTTAPEDRTATGFRPDVQALRAVAVSAVVAFHMGLPVVNGGFVGVDVFFVISGFLITRLLINEHDRTGTISYTRFITRRVRRLLPLAAVVLVCTVVACAFLVSPFELSSVAGDAGWSGAYLANYRFAFSGEDYFAIIPSPVTHFWSLAVEEQFYLVWPWILLLLLPRWRRFLLPATLVLIAMSLGHSVIEASQHPTFAYYSTTTRAWQLLAGALVAITAPSGLARLSERARTVLAVVGVVVVLASVVLVNETLAYPGVAALPPVLGTMAVLLAAPGVSSPLHGVMTLPPVLLLADLSYGWYLWHWPLIVLGESVVANEAQVRIVAGLIALGLAWLTYRWVEKPLRDGPLLKVPSRALVAGVAATGIVVATATSVFAYNEHRLSQPRLATLDAALHNEADIVGDDCFSPDLTLLLAECRGGTPGGPRVVLSGDSTARMWYAAFDELGQDLGFEVVLFGGNGCNVLGFPSDVLQADCQSYTDGLEATFDDLDADAVVFSHAAGNREERFGDEWLRRLGDFVQTRQSEGSSVGVIGNVPKAPFDVESCLVDNEDSSACDLAEEPSMRAPERWAAFQAPVLGPLGVVELDPSAFMCQDGVCPAVVDGSVVTFRDADHVTSGYAAVAAPDFAPFLEELLPMLSERTSG